MPSSRPRVSAIHEIAIAGVPTFTDALQQFEREKGVPLRGLQCAMAIAGAASGETISLVRSRWTISRAGLMAIFGTQPVILNDVAAARRATVGHSEHRAAARRRHAKLQPPRAYGMMMVEEGVGAAIVDVDRDFGVRVLETEAGHMDFAPTNEREERLLKTLRGNAPVVSWEKMLMLDRQDPIWGQAARTFSNLSVRACSRAFSAASRST